MSLNEMMRLAGQIQTLGLPEEQEEALMVQAADLVRFKEFFADDLQLVDPFSHRVSLVQGKEGMAGICFCGHEDMAALPQILAETARLKRLKKIQNLWFVFVAGSRTATGSESLNTFIARHSIKQLCSRVFLLNYFNATLQSF